MGGMVWCKSLSPVNICVDGNSKPKAWKGAVLSSASELLATASWFGKRAAPRNKGRMIFMFLDFVVLLTKPFCASKKNEKNASCLVLTFLVFCHRQSPNGTSVHNELYTMSDSVIFLFIHRLN